MNIENIYEITLQLIEREDGTFLSAIVWNDSSLADDGGSSFDSALKRAVELLYADEYWGYDGRVEVEVKTTCSYCGEYTTDFDVADEKFACRSCIEKGW